MNLKIGIDEAGRGPWAGPVFAGLVVLNAEQEEFLKSKGITDSKKLTEKKREELFPLILQNSIYAKVKFQVAEEIDKVGIYKSTINLIKELVSDKSFKELNIENPVILIDGVFPNLQLKDFEKNLLNHECIIKGDEKEVSISAASILAKVRRDAYMIKLDEKFPDYKFEQHKGYGTKLHSELLKQFGPCEEHRKSFKPVKLLLK